MVHLLLMFTIVFMNVLPLYIINYYYDYQDIAKMEEGLQHAHSAKTQRGLVKVWGGDRMGYIWLLVYQSHMRHHHLTDPSSFIQDLLAKVSEQYALQVFGGFVSFLRIGLKFETGGSGYN